MARKKVGAKRARTKCRTFSIDTVLGDLSLPLAHSPGIIAGFDKLTLSGLIDGRYKLQQARLVLKHQADAISKLETELQSRALSRMQAQGLEKAGGKLAQSSIKEQLFGTITDWLAVLKFAGNPKNNASGCVIKRVSASQIDQLIEDGVNVPGVIVERMDKLSLTKVGGK